MARKAYISALLSFGWVEISAQICLTNEGCECISAEKELLDYSAIGQREENAMLQRTSEEWLA